MNNPMMIQRRRNTTARNSRNVAWRTPGEPPPLPLPLPLPGFGFMRSVGGVDDEYAVEVEQLPPQQRRPHDVRCGAEHLRGERVEIADGVARDVDDVEAADRQVLR